MQRIKDSKSPTQVCSSKCKINISDSSVATRLTCSEINEKSAS